MLCFVYASQRQNGSYLWLAHKDEFSVLPEPLKALLGDLRPVLEVDLDRHRKLPSEDAVMIRAHLQDQGWHLQLPPTDTLAGNRHFEYGRKPVP